MYTLEKWIEYHGEGVSPKDYKSEFEKWLEWRLSVDRGDTLSKTMFILSSNVAYESPTTGKAITSRKARNDDLARSGCVEYDPEMKTDHNNRLKEEEIALDKSFDDVIDKTLEQMPADALGRLNNELGSGVDVEVQRLTVEGD